MAFKDSPIPGTGTAFSQAALVQFVDLPVKDKVYNLHLWLLLVSRLLFDEYKFSLLSIIKQEPEYSALHEPLMFLYKHGRSDALTISLHPMLSSVLLYCPLPDREQVLDYIDLLKLEWDAAVREMNDDVNELFAETRMPFFKTTKGDSAIFNVWYEGRFELTSRPHYNAYRAKANGKDKIAHISLLLTTFPANARILATNSTASWEHCSHSVKRYVPYSGLYICEACGLATLHSTDGQEY